MQLGGLEWGGVYLCLCTGSIQGEQKQARTHTSTRSTVHTLIHTHKDRCCASNWRWEVWRLAETGRRWEIKISSVERERERERNLVSFIPDVPRLFGSKRNPHAPSTPIAHTNTRAHTPTSDNLRQGPSADSPDKACYAQLWPSAYC